MVKKIVILNGSPRPHGNTKGLIDAFTQGAQQKGHQVTCFNLGQLNIHGCLGCFGFPHVLLGLFRPTQMCL